MTEATSGGTDFRRKEQTNTDAAEGSETFLNFENWIGHGDSVNHFSPDILSGGDAPFRAMTDLTFMLIMRSR